MIGTVYVIDACLTPVGLLVAIAGGAHAFGFLLVLPLLALLAALAADRSRRIQDAAGRLDELTAGHERLDRAIHRVGEAFGSKLDRAALAGIMVDTAVEALGADFGRVSLASGTIDHGDAPDSAVAAAEQRALKAGALQVAPYGEHVAMAQPLTGGGAGGDDRAAGGRPARRVVHARTSRRCSATSRGRPRSRWRTSRCTTSCTGRRPSTS